jgi:hypothetical protein
MILNQRNDKSITLSFGNPSGNEITRPLISPVDVDSQALRAICPMHAIGVNPVRIDLGKCNFCRECSNAFPSKITFTDDQAIATNVRDRLIILENDTHTIHVDHGLVRKNIKSLSTNELTFFLFPNTSPVEGGIAFLPYGITIDEDPSKCVGVIIQDTLEHISEENLADVYATLRDPKIIVVAGREAISQFESPSRHAEFFATHKIDLYVPGDPATLQALGQGVNELIQS